MYDFFVFVNLSGVFGGSMGSLLMISLICTVDKEGWRLNTEKKEVVILCLEYRSYQ